MDISTILSRRAWTLISDIGDLFTELTLLYCFALLLVLLSCICTGLLYIILYIQSRVVLQFLYSVTGHRLLAGI